MIKDEPVHNGSILFKWETFYLFCSQISRKIMKPTIPSAFDCCDGTPVVANTPIPDNKLHTHVHIHMGKPPHTDKPTHMNTSTHGYINTRAHIHLCMLLCNVTNVINAIYKLSFGALSNLTHNTVRYSPCTWYCNPVKPGFWN